MIIIIIRQTFTQATCASHLDASSPLDQWFPKISSMMQWLNLLQISSRQYDVVTLPSRSWTNRCGWQDLLVILCSINLFHAELNVIKLILHDQTCISCTVATLNDMRMQHVYVATRESDMHLTSCLTFFSHIVYSG